MFPSVKNNIILKSFALGIMPNYNEESLQPV